MDDGQWQSDGPVRRGGGSDADLQSDSESSRSPDENQNRLVEEAEEVQEGPRGGQKLLPHDNTNNNGDDEEYDSSKLEEEEEEGEDKMDDEEEMDSTSGVYSPELDGHIRDSPTPSPSPTVSDSLVSPEGPPHNDASRHGFICSLTLQEMEEQGDHPLLPQCLHQIAEAFMREEDYERAVRFVQLERLYHERVLSNLAAIQEQLEERWSLIGGCQDRRESRSDLDAEHLEKLRHICRTHRQPAQNAEKCALVSKVLRNSVIEEPAEDLIAQQLSCCSGSVMEEHNTSELHAQQEVIQTDDLSKTASPTQQSEQGPSPSLATPPPSSSSALTDSSSSPACEEVRGEEESKSVAASDGDATTQAEHPRSESLMDDAQPGDVEVQHPQTDTGDLVDTGQGVVETGAQAKREGGEEEDGTGGDREVPGNTPEFDSEEDGHGVESLDVANVSTLDDMAKRIQVEEITPAAGLVSILKRRATLEAADNSAPAALKPVAKRKVRFREPDEGLDQDEVGGDSWLLLLLLCLATVVISVGGTALYCTFGDAQSSVCTDFSHNMDFYVGRMQRGVDELKHWFSPSS